MSSINSRYSSPLDLITQSKLVDTHKKSSKASNALSPTEKNPLTLAGKGGHGSNAKKTKPAIDGYRQDPSKGINPGTNAGKRTGATPQSDNPDGFTLDPSKGFNPGTRGGTHNGASSHDDNPDGFTLDPSKGFNPGVESKDDDARKAAEGLVSTTFIEPILKQIRESNDAPPPFGPSKVEKQFGALLDTSLADEIVKASDFPLVDRIAADLSKHGKGNAPAAPEHRTELDLEA